MSKELSEKSLDELKSQEKGQTIILSVFIGLVVIMAVAGGYLTYLKGFNTFTVLPVAFLPLVLVFFNNLKKTKAEIGSRP